MGPFVWVIIAVAILIIISVSTYNNMVGMRNRIYKSCSNIDTILQKRFDLLTNLFAEADRALAHESETYSQITKARSGYEDALNAYKARSVNTEDGTMATVQADKHLTNAFSAMRMTMENYPELAALETSKKVMEENIQMESTLNAARRVYNSNVNEYRDGIQRFPNVIVASMFGFRNSYDLYTVESDEVRQAVRRTPHNSERK
jgi:LemA protein